MADQESSDRWKRIKAVFFDTMKQSPEERSGFLDEACQGDPALRAEVEAMIDAHMGADDFLETPPLVPESIEKEGEALLDTWVGQYRLVRVISSGGMGIVYEALQEHPKRTVAIKVMKEGIASKHASRRFEYESQILAELKHPGIAQVIEAGTQQVQSPFLGHDREMEVPYFVMEYIEGARSLTDYAQDTGLSTRERIELFLQACEAVHHGHQKGIIHRDLKPGNMLVDSSGRVKIIDFGIARATDVDVTLTTQDGDMGRLIGTLQYMSPEQCLGDSKQLDVRSDIYTLGIVLYELLCEKLPYDLHNTAVLEATRQIRETPPKRPSTVNRSLKGDVETIVLKALEKDRNHRYQTTEGFSDDLRRYLRGEVILAKPASTALRLWKYVKRNPSVGTAAGVALVALLGFLFYVAFISYPRIRAERNNALEQAEKATRIYKFFEDILTSADPRKTGREVKVQDLLYYAVDRIGREFPDQPEIEASLRHSLGVTYMNMALYDEAETQLSKAVEIRRREWGEENPETMESMIWLGTVFRGKGRLAEAEALHGNLLKTCQRVLDDTHRVKVRCLQQYAASLKSQGRFAESKPYLLEALDICSRAIEKTDIITFECKRELAYALDGLGEYAEAEAMLREIFEVYCQILGEKHITTILTKGRIADMAFKRGRFSEAEPIYRDVLQACRQELGEDHNQTLITMTNLATVLKYQGRFAEAEAMYQEVLQARLETLGEMHPGTLMTRNNLANVLKGQGRLAEAEAMHREVLQIRLDTLGEGHPDTFQSKNNLANTLRYQGRLSEAEEIYRALIETECRVLGDAHPDTLISMSNLAITLTSQDRLAEAEKLHREVLKKRQSTLGKDHRNTLSSMYNLARIVKNQGKLVEAEDLFQEVLAARSRVLGEKHRDTIEALYLLACVLADQGEPSQAEPLFQEFLKVREADLGKDHPDILQVKYQLGLALQQQNRPKEAESFYQEVFAARSRVLGKEHPKTLISMNALAIVLMHQGLLEEAEDLHQQVLDIANRVPSDDPVLIPSIEMDYGLCLIALKRYAEAEEHMLAGYRGFKNAKGEDSEYTGKALDRVIDLYEAWNKPEEAARWQEKRQGSSKNNGL